MDVGKLVGLLGGEGAASGVEFGRSVRVGEEFGRHVDWMLWVLWWFGKRVVRRWEKSNGKSKGRSRSLAG